MKNYINSLCFSTDQKTMIVGYGDNNIKIYDINSFELKSSFVVEKVFKIYIDCLGN